MGEHSNTNSVACHITGRFLCSTMSGFAIDTLSHSLAQLWVCERLEGALKITITANVTRRVAKRGNRVS